MEGNDGQVIKVEAAVIRTPVGEVFLKRHQNQSWNLELKPEKKRIYEQAVFDRRGNFTPLVMSAGWWTSSQRGRTLKTSSKLRPQMGKTLLSNMWLR